MLLTCYMGWILDNKVAVDQSAGDAAEAAVMLLEGAAVLTFVHQV